MDLNLVVIAGRIQALRRTNPGGSQWVLDVAVDLPKEDGGYRFVTAFITKTQARDLLKRDRVWMAGHLGIGDAENSVVMYAKHVEGR